MRELKVGMKLKLGEELKKRWEWVPHSKTTFYVISILAYSVDLEYKTIGFKKRNCNVSLRKIWDFFKIENEQLEFNFND